VKILLLSCFMTLNVPLASSSEKALSIKEFLTLAKKNDPNFTKIISDREKLTFIVDLGLPSRKAVVSLKNEHGLSSSDSENTSILSGSISKDIIESGTNLSISHTKTTSTDRKEDLTEIRLEQSLYKNLLGRDVRLKKQALVNEEEITRLEVLENYENYLDSILGQYFNFKKAIIDKNLSKKAYEETIKLRNNVKLKKSKKIASQTDLDKAELQVLVRKEDLLSKEEQLQTSTNSIQRIIGYTRAIPSVHADNLLDKKLYELNLNENTKTSDLRQEKISSLRQSIATKEQTLARRSYDPSLSLIGGYNIDNSSTTNRNEAIIGLKIDIPIGDTKSSADFLNKSLSVAQSNLDLDITIKDLEKQKSITKAKLLKTKEKVDVSKEKLKLMERIVRSEEKRYQYGKVDLDRIIEINSDFFGYKAQYQSNILDYNRIVLSWLSLNDKLIPAIEKF